MPLADTFQQIVDSLPSDWTDLELDLRVQEDRYIDAATLLVQVNAQPYSHHDWHWRIMVAHQFGHAAAAPPTHGTLKLLDDQGIAGELEETATLGVYSHVHHDVKLRAEAAGFDLVVPRSRMAREGADLVERLAQEPGSV